MKVKKLIKMLSKMPGNAEVILQKDSEGNGYSPCYGIEAGMYKLNTAWSGEFFSKEDCDSGYYGFDYKENAIVIFPAN